MTAIVDAMAALIDFLKADTDVSGLVSARVFGDELPEAETASMPRKAVVINQSGGATPDFAAATVPLQVFRCDVFCYGENPYEADRVRRAVYVALKRMERNVQSGVLLHWARPAGGMASIRDPSTDWPIAWNSWQVSADERAA